MPHTDRTIIDALSLSVRATNCLLGAGLTTVPKIKAYGVARLRKLPNMSPNAVDEIIAVLGERGHEIND